MESGKYVEYVPTSSLINTDVLQNLTNQDLVKNVIDMLKQVSTIVHISENNQETQVVKQSVDENKKLEVFQVCEEGDCVLENFKSIINFENLTWENLQDTKSKISSLPNVAYTSKKLEKVTSKFSRGIPDLIWTILYNISYVLERDCDFIKFNKQTMKDLFTGIVFSILNNIEKYNEDYTYNYKIISSNGSTELNPISEIACALFNLHVSKSSFFERVFKRNSLPSIEYGRNAFQLRINRNLYQNEEVVSLLRSIFSNNNYAMIKEHKHEIRELLNKLEKE